MSKAVKIKADIMWAFLDRVNDMSNKYQVDLCNLSPAAVGALEDMGLKVNSKEGKGFYITCKSQNPMRAYKDGDELAGILVGNGSQAVAVVGSYEWNNKYGAGISPSLKRLDITSLEVYEDAGGEAEVLEVDDEVL